MDQPNLPGEEEPIVAGAVPEEVEGAQPALLEEPLGYLMTVLRSGANGQLLEFTYLQILVPIEDLINTLTDRQQLLIIVSFLEQDVHMYQLRHVPNPQNQILMRTHRERYTDFHFELLDEYLNLLIHSEDSQDRAHGMSVLLQHLFNTNGSALESENHRIDTTLALCSICQDDYLPSDGIIVLPCHISHHFHRGCIETWLLTNLDCPLCRATVRLPQRVLRRPS
ncbi:hypothetical protein MJO28_009719 [Puccinia striiformis f. sp. tritici]|uniref:Uncharacterized protein n=1 Tax=Puccinia striiformis f. sp. tritici TaxID=168172 RepID=A0ACC0E8F3_9BASI|nr:hypothetical protein MJO28_009719 [Puccinia striiformis f. sp. tritici]KAI9607374.1 hypothetical protein H4Q26_005893 [Puccinia striiformis f. sp. tritici PST-130]